MFNSKVTLVAIRNQVSESVGFFVSIKPVLSEWVHVMNIQLFSKLVFGNATALAYVLVTVSNAPALCHPVRTVVRMPSSLPRAVISATAITRRSLPFSPAFFRTEVVRLNLTWNAFK